MSETLTTIDRYSALSYDLETWAQDSEINEARILFTEQGLALSQSRPEIEDVFVPEYIEKFKAQIVGGTAVKSGVSTRNYIWRGADAEVYELAPGIAIKEVIKRADPVASVERMALLSDLVDELLPEWIEVPDQYGVVIPESTSDAFIAMQKVNSGINVDWLLEQECLNSFQRETVRRDIGIVGPKEQQQISDDYKEVEELIYQAVEGLGGSFEKMLPDLHEGNVLVERLQDSIDDKPYKLWLIDQ